MFIETEIDVDMGYLLEDGDIDLVILNDENCEHESRRFVPERTCEIVAQTWEDRGGDEEDTYKYELSCGHTVRMLDCEPLCNCPRCGRRVIDDRQGY